MADAKPSAGRPTRRAAVGVRLGRSVLRPGCGKRKLRVFLMRPTKVQVATRATCEAVR